MIASLQAMAGNRAVQRLLSGPASPATVETRTERYFLDAEIPAVSRTADDSAPPDDSAPAATNEVIDGVPEPVAAEEDAGDEGHCEGDAVSATLSYTPTVDHPATAPPSGEFGECRGNHIHPNTTEFKYSSQKKAYSVKVEYQNDIKVLVCADDGPRGQKNITSAADAHITKANYPKVVTDLTPDPKNQGGAPPRTQFWARDLTLLHEDFHATDGQRFCSAAVTAAQADLNKQTVPAPTDNKFSELNALMKPIPGKIVSARGTGMANGGEERAYKAGAASYQARATEIASRGTAGKYAEADTQTENPNRYAGDSTESSTGSAIA